MFFLLCRVLGADDQGIMVTRLRLGSDSDI